MLEFIAGVAGFAFSTLMMMVLFVVEIVFLMIIGGIARSKGRNVLGWIVLGAISPILTLIALLILTRKYPKTDNEFRDVPELSKYNPLVVGVIGIFAYISNADGQVDEKEYNSVYLLLKKSYGMSKKDLTGYRDIIYYTKTHPQMIDRYTAVIRKYTKDKNRGYENIRLLAMLCNVVAINGVEVTEILALRKVMEDLGVDITEMTPITQEMMNQGATQEHIDDLVEVM